MGKFLKNMFGIFWQLFDNIWYFWPRNINNHIQNINFASTKNQGACFWAPNSNFHFFSNSRVPFIPKSFEKNRESVFSCFLCCFWIYFLRFSTFPDWFSSLGDQFWPNEKFKRPVFEPQTALFIFPKFPGTIYPKVLWSKFGNMFCIFVSIFLGVLAFPNLSSSLGHPCWPNKKFRRPIFDPQAAIFSSSHSQCL